MKVRNKGVTGRVIAVPGHPAVEVEPGGVVEVDDTLGKSLLAQPARWERVSDKSAKRGTDKES